LRSLLKQTANNQVAENLTQAIAVHDDPQAEVILEELARPGHLEASRVRAVLWLGQFGGHVPLLSALAGDANERFSVRQAAVRAIGKGSDPQVIATLRDLYASVNDQAVKEAIIDSVAKSREHGAAVEFLTKLAQSEQNPGLTNEPSRATIPEQRSVTKKKKINRKEAQKTKQNLFVLYVSL